MNEQDIRKIATDLNLSIERAHAKIYVLKEEADTTLSKLKNIRNRLETKNPEVLLSQLKDVSASIIYVQVRLPDAKRLLDDEHDVLQSLIARLSRGLR